MQFYSNSKPDLIVSKVRKSIVYIMKKKSSFTTFSDKVSQIVGNFYNEYICDSKLIIIILAAITIMLLCRYYDKQNKLENRTYKDKNKKEGFTTDEQKIMKDIMKTQTSHLKYDTQPSFNSLYSVNDQFQPVNYLPDQIPTNIPGKGLVYDKNLPYSNQYENLNNPAYDYNGAHTNPSRSYYNGTYDTYDNTQNNNIENPLGFSTEFNATTGKFISEMTSANHQNITDYQKLINNMNNDLSNSISYGPEGLKQDELESTMVPPWATDI